MFCLQTSLRLIAFLRYVYTYLIVLENVNCNNATYLRIRIPLIIQIEVVIDCDLGMSSCSSNNHAEIVGWIISNLHKSSLRLIRAEWRQSSAFHSLIANRADIFTSDFHYYWKMNFIIKQKNSTHEAEGIWWALLLKHRRSLNMCALFSIWWNCRYWRSQLVCWPNGNYVLHAVWVYPSDFAWEFVGLCIRRAVRIAGWLFWSSEVIVSELESRATSGIRTLAWSITSSNQGQGCLTLWLV